MESKIIQGDCLIKLKELEDNSIDSIVTDPPYELGFMGKSWDNTGIANNPLMWAECLRVLKPGGHLLAFSGTRTYHRMAVAIEDAGFEVRDMIEWVYGSGFPKSLNIGKAVDKLQGVERKIIGYKEPFGREGRNTKPTGNYNAGLGGNYTEDTKDLRPIYDGTSEWEGWGTALKPAHEPICMARKPLAEKTVAENCLKWGTGGINIDESRVDTNGEEVVRNFNDFSNQHGNKFGNGEPIKTERSEKTTDGRWPANLLHDNSEEVRECFPETGSVKGRQTQYSESDFAGDGGWKGEGIGQRTYDGSGNASRFFKSIENDPLQEWAENEVAEHREEIIEDIKKEYGVIKGKSIIYQPKASKSERNKGCEGLEEKPKVFNGQSDKPSTDMKDVEKRFTTLPKVNNHPTVKPIALMEYLIKMVTPKGGIVLDPFAGSGSTLVAAKQNGYQYIGIEMTAEYIPIIEARLLDKQNKQL